MSEPHWITIDELLEQHHDISRQEIERWLFLRDDNGLGPAVRVVGRKIEIDADGFERWLDEQDEAFWRENIG